MTVQFCTLICLTGFLGIISVSALRTTSVSGFYRIEAELGHLENTLGIQHNGEFCDEMTPCDPVIYTHIDVERPLAPWPGPVKKAADMQMLTWRRNTNSYEINQTVTKDICGGGLSNINVRTEVLDEDFLGKYDLIDQFDCKFFPPAADTSEGLNSPASYKTWSLFEECQAKNQQGKIRLFFRWRVYPIEMSECGKEHNPAVVGKVAYVTTTKPL